MVKVLKRKKEKTYSDDLANSSVLQILTRKELVLDLLFVKSSVLRMADTLLLSHREKAMEVLLLLA